MEIKEKYIAEYSQTGHPQYPEDTWAFERAINNVDELFQYMKDLHKKDAYSFNNFPLNGSCGMNCFSFSVEKWVEVKGERYINPKREKAEKPEYFDEAAKMYKAFCDRMRTTLPNLRKARDRKEKEKRERAMLAELQGKYGA